MGTHAVVAIETDNKVYKAIYVHYDGDSAGDVLREHYNTYDAAMALIDGGDVVGIKASPSLCRPYGNKPTTGLSLYDVLITMKCQTRYVYTWKDGSWIFGR